MKHTRLAMNKLRLAQLEKVAVGTLVLVDATTAKRAVGLLRWWAEEESVSLSGDAEVFEQRRRTRECAADLAAAIERRVS